MQQRIIAALVGSTMLVPALAFAQNQAPDPNRDQGQVAQSECARFFTAVEQNQDRQLPWTAEQLNQIRDSNNEAACRDALEQLQAALGPQQPVEPDQQAQLQPGQQAAQPQPEPMQAQRDDQGAPDQIVVEAPAPAITVQQGAPEITVRQAQPDIRVTQGQPEITVHQPAPLISVDIPQPEIIIRMPPPNVDVAQAQPQVEVRQPRPEVRIVQPEEQAQIQVQEDQGQAARVQIAEAEPRIAIGEAQQPTVRYEREEPRITVNQAEGQPTVRFEQMTQEEADAAGLRQSGQDQAEAGAADGQPLDERQQMAANQPEQQAAGQPPPEPQGMEQVAASQLVGLTVVNDNGDELGTVDQVVLNTDNNRQYAIIAYGGFLGVGEKSTAFPLEELILRGDRLVISGMTDEQIAELPEWNPEGTRYQVLDGNQAARIRLVQQ